MRLVYDLNHKGTQAMDFNGFFGFQRVSTAGSLCHSNKVPTAKNPLCQF